MRWDGVTGLVGAFELWLNLNMATAMQARCRPKAPEAPGQRHRVATGGGAMLASPESDVGASRYSIYDSKR